MNNQIYKITCPRCGNELKSTSRSCLKCGYLNPDHPDNQNYMNQYGKNMVEEYSVHSQVDASVIQNKSANNKGIDLNFSNNLGNYTLCFIINFLCYFILIIGAVCFCYFNNSGDIYLTLKSELCLLLFGISIFSLVQYSIQLVYMKMNRKWYLALIPIVNLYVLSDAINQKKILNILIFIPIIGQIYYLSLLYKMGKSFKKSGLLTMLLPFIMFPIIGFGGSCFNGVCYISEKGSLEKEYGKKRFFWISNAIIIVASIVIFVYSNIVGINGEIDRFSSYYLYFASKRIVRRTAIKVENQVYECEDGGNILYFYFSDVYDYFFLPFYVFRDPIEAYVKVVITPGTEDDENHYDYYISMTDLKYGYAETAADDIKLSTITRYSSLEKSYEQGNQCIFRKTA